MQEIASRPQISDCDSGQFRVQSLPYQHWDQEPIGLTRSVDIEGAHHSDTHSILCRVISRRVLRHDLGVGIWVDRLQRMIFTDRQRAGMPVDVRADQSNGRIVLPAELKYVDGTEHVGLIKWPGASPALRYEGAAGKVEYVADALKWQFAACDVAISPTVLEYLYREFLEGPARRCRPTKPSEPVTSTRSLMGQKLVSALLELIYRLHIIIGTADIEPVPRMTFDVDALSTPEEFYHEIIKSKPGI